MTKDEALKLALEALQWKWGAEFSPTFELQVINAIKEALAQPEQEPLGWCDSKTGWIDFHRFKPLRKPSAPDAEWLPLYTSPPKREWVGLTIEQMEDIGFNLLPAVAQKDFVQFASVLEAKLKELNHG